MPLNHAQVHPLAWQPRPSWAPHHAPSSVTSGVEQLALAQRAGRRQRAPRCRALCAPGWKRAPAAGAGPPLRIARASSMPSILAAFDDRQVEAGRAGRSPAPSAARRRHGAVPGTMPPLTVCGSRHAPVGGVVVHHQQAQALSAAACPENRAAALGRRAGGWSAVAPPRLESCRPSARRTLLIASSSPVPP